MALVQFVDDSQPYLNANNLNNNFNELDGKIGTTIWVNITGNTATFQPFSASAWSNIFSVYGSFKIWYYFDNHINYINCKSFNLGETYTISESSGTLTRQVKITDSTINIYEGKYQGGTNNSAIIPICIIGYK